MDSRLASLLLVLPSLACADVISTVTICNPVPPISCSDDVTTTTGEFASTVSVRNASASGQLFNAPADPFLVLNASASKLLGDPPIDASASFDVLVLVTGTDQSGFLLFYPIFEHGINILFPSVIQTARASFVGEPFYDLGSNPTFIYVPYVAGVPVHLYGSVGAHVGSPDVPGFASGDAFGTFELRIRIASQRVDDPRHQDPMYISGASWTTVPEPGTRALLLAGLVAMLSLRLRVGVR